MALLHLIGVKFGRGFYFRARFYTRIIRFRESI